MTAPENATSFFHACESGKGWDQCSQYVAPGAKFSAQSDPLVDIGTVEDYVNWMAGLANGIAPGCSYEIHASAYDEAAKAAIFFATFTGTHSGEGGPVPPTNKETISQYVYVFTMNDDGKISNMQKVWNDPWAMRELGWM
jgi:hypothetical protein